MKSRFEFFLRIFRSSHPEVFLRKGVLNRPATLLKKILSHRCFSVNFSTFLRTLFLQNTSGRLLGHDVGHDVFGSVEVDCCNAYKNVTGYLLQVTSSKSTMETSEQRMKSVQTNFKDTRTTSWTSFWYLYF